MSPARSRVARSAPLPAGPATRPGVRASARPVALGATSVTLGVRLTRVAKSRVAGEMRIGRIHVNRNGRVSGGAIMAFADALGAAGTVANLPPGHRTSTIESKTNFFAPGEGPLLKGVSVPLHIGRTTMVWQTTVTNEDGRMVALVTQTQIVVPESPATAGRSRAG
jgi:uncharacterized protein (TIGR00369 family)